MTHAPLILAIPSKGRLQEHTAAFLARAGMPFVRSGGARDYRGTLEGVNDVEVLFCSASDIAGLLASGGAHFGVTGEDLVREHIPNVDETVELITPLGFGKADVIVAVPQAWIDVWTMADLDDVAATMRARHGRKLRIATKYITLTRSFFAHHHLFDYRIVESLGATEGAPASGAAEAIVDITTTGATLQANALKVLEDGVILRSQAHLVASMAANWTDTARQAAHWILSRISAEETARTYREVRISLARFDATGLEDIYNRFQTEPLFGETTSRDGELSLLCPKQHVYALSSYLIEHGVPTVAVRELTAVFRESNPLIERLINRLTKLS